MRIFQRQDREQSWWVDFVDGQGRRHRRRVGTSKREAEAVLAQIRVSSVKGEWGLLSNDAPIKSALEQYLKKCANNCTPDTFRRYKYALDTFTKYLAEYHPGLTRLKTLRPQHIQDFIAWRLQCTSYTRKRAMCRATANGDLKVVKAFLNFCVDSGHLLASPARKIAKMKETDSVVVPAFSEDEIEKLMALATQRKPWLLPVILFLADTGCRFGECRYLTVQDLDLERGWVHIRRKAGVWTPKSSGKTIRERSIPLTTRLREQLREVIKNRTTQDSWVFHNKRGGQLTHGAARCFGDLCKWAGLPTTRVHALRHSFASRMVRLAPVPVVSKLLGHSSLQITQKYIHTDANDLQAAIQALSEPPMQREVEVEGAGTAKRADNARNEAS